MRCPVCSAPSIGSRCVFCRVELAPGPAPDPQEVLDHLAGTIPGASAHRGAFDRGPIREVELQDGFTARLKRAELELEPGLPLEEWLEELLAGLRRRAQSDLALRSALTGQGWALS